MVLAAFLRFIFLLVFLVQILSAEEEVLLHRDDIKKVMDQIFSQHVEKKEISPDILKNSFKIYINQFDPMKIYLLESEVSYFLDMDDSKLQQLVKEYNKQNYSIYEKLNSVIQNSIERAQKNRISWINRQGNYFGKSFNKTQQNYTTFAKDLQDLKSRQNDAIFNYILGASSTEQLARLKEYDKNRRNFEDQYLFVDLNGKQLSDSQKENLLTMHSIKALAKSLDAHTSFLNPNEAYDMRVRLEKGFDGIGIILEKNENGFQIVKILSGSSAESDKRISVNDFLIKVDNKDIKNESLSDVMRMLRGKNGSTVALQIERRPEKLSGNQPQIFNITLTREAITVDDGRVETNFVNYGDGIIGIIKLQSFYQGNNGISSERDVKKAIEDLQKKGKLKGLILDLRENNGGFLTQAVKVAGLFITNGVVVISKYSNGEEKFYRDMDGKTSYDGPLIVLTSRATASAAEIVAQALQDYGVALIVGDEHTYGKGTIQSQTVTNDGGEASNFKVTVGKYYTVSGKTPQIHGVQANIVVPSPYNLEPIGEEYLDYPIGQDNIPNSFIDSLNDIDPGLRPWYLRYYMPTLQKQTSQYSEMTPILKKRSQERISKNSHFKGFLQKKHFDDENINGKIEMAYFNANDPQLYETINIIKDIISIQNKTGKKNVSEAVSVSSQ